MSMLSVNALSVAYGNRQVLKGVDFDLPAGQILAVIGPNGAGKSTLIRALSGVTPAQGGEVRAGQRDLLHLPANERARLLAVLPQAVNLPPAFTGWETVMMGRTPHLNFLGQTGAQDEEVVRIAMQRTDTLSLAERRVGEISGGEQQRLLLARALAQSAPILLMDEPTAHLDLQYQINLLDLIRNLALQDGLAVLMILHDLNLVARYADRVGLLLEGRLEALGTAEEVLTPDLLSRAYHLKLQVIPSSNGHPLLITPWGKE